MHRWRAHSSAVLTGSGTVLADDPALTVRHVRTQRQPLRVIVDSNFSTPADAKVLNGPGKALIATANDDYEFTGEVDVEQNEVIYVPTASRTVDLVALMDHLSQREINDVLVEAGSTLCGALLKADLVDELLLYLAPKILGNDASGMFHLSGLSSLADCVDFDVIDIRQMGVDIRVRLRKRQ